MILLLSIKISSFLSARGRPCLTRSQSSLPGHARFSLFARGGMFVVGRGKIELGNKERATWTQGLNKPSLRLVKNKKKRVGEQPYPRGMGHGTGTPLLLPWNCQDPRNRMLQHVSSQGHSPIDASQPESNTHLRDSPPCVLFPFWSALFPRSGLSVSSRSFDCGP